MYHLGSGVNAAATTLVAFDKAHGVQTQAYSTLVSAHLITSQADTVHSAHFTAPFHSAYSYSVRAHALSRCLLSVVSSFLLIFKRLPNSNPETINCCGCRNSLKSDTVSALCPLAALAALLDRVYFLILPLGTPHYHTFVTKCPCSFSVAV